MAFVVALDRRAELGPGVDEDVVPATVGVTVDQQGRLVDTVDDAVGGNVLEWRRPAAQTW